TDPTQPQSPTGILVLDKPVGPTSMAACRKIRAALVRAGAPKRVKVGHGGTLDPMASGVLVILIGKATKLSETVMAGDKTYLADIDLAATSPTDDSEAEPIPTGAAPISRDAFERALPAFTGTIQQAPPAHSAMKVGGLRAYELARAGKLHKLEPRPVRIDAIRLLHFRWPRAVIDVRCGKGVYIRSLARDLGEAAGTGAMLAGLRRTRVGQHDIETAVPMHRIPAQLTQANLLPINA
ncbi:MAG: tRNA pseudouridine(55) synthase TruB, partial [Planctomycetota bacterium]